MRCNYLKRIRKALKKNKFEKKVILVRNIYALINRRKFGRLGKNSYIWNPIFLSGMKYYYFGDEVGIWSGARIEAIDEWKGKTYYPKLHIGNNVMIGQDCHITLAESIVIEDGVVCSGRVTVTDITHVASDKNVPILEQGIVTKPVKIREGAFVGINSTILPGVTVGKHAIVGANSVVTKDVPDYATVVGTPARVVKVENKSN